MHKLVGIVRLLYIPSQHTSHAHKEPARPFHFHIAVILPPVACHKVTILLDLLSKNLTLGASYISLCQRTCAVDRPHARETSHSGDARHIVFAVVASLCHIM